MSILIRDNANLSPFRAAFEYNSVILSAHVLDSKHPAISTVSIIEHLSATENLDVPNKVISCSGEQQYVQLDRLFTKDLE